MRRRKINAITGFSSVTISKYVNKLVKSGHINIIREGKYDSINGSEATTYHIPILDNKLTDDCNIEKLIISDNFNIIDIYNNLLNKFK